MIKGWKSDDIKNERLIDGAFDGAGEIDGIAEDVGRKDMDGDIDGGDITDGADDGIAVGVS